MNKKKVVLSFIWAWILIYIIYVSFFSPKVVENFETTFSEVAVEKKAFTSSMELSGTTKIKNEQLMRFNIAWKVTELNFKVGERVRAFESLAWIDSTEINNEIQKAQLDLSNAKIKLKKFIDNLNNSWLKSSTLDLEIMESQIKQKEIEIDFLKNNNEKILENKMLELEQSANNYKILEKESEKNISNFNMTDLEKEQILETKKIELSKAKWEYEKFKNNFQNRLTQELNEYHSKLENQYFSLQSNITDFEKSIKDTEDVLDRWEKKFYYSQYFSAKNSSYKSDAVVFLLKSQSSLKDFKDAFNNIKSKIDSENIIKTLVISKKLNEDLYNTFNSVAQWFENSVETIGFTDSTISGYSSTFSWLRSSANSQITSITTIIDELKNYDSVEKIKKDLQEKLEIERNNIASLELDISKAFDNQDFLVETADFNINLSKLNSKITKNKLVQEKLDYDRLKKDQVETLKQEYAALEKLKLQYSDLIIKDEELKNLSTNQDYIFLKNEVTQNEVNVNDAYKKLENYTLQAPFDWIITKIDINLWDRLNADTEKYISIVDPDTIEIDTFVNQADIVKVSLWLNANINLWSYPDHTFTWSITEIDTNPTEVNWMTKFKLKILLNNPDNFKLYSWMKSKIKISLDTIPEWIVVPYTAVNTDNETGKKYVTITKGNNEKEKRFIEVWFTDGENYQVLEWLEEDEKILEIDYNAEKFKSDDMWFWWF